MGKKFLIMIVGIVVAFLGYIFVIAVGNIKKYDIINDENEKKVNNTNALTMMLETEAGSGEYIISSDSAWPQEGYTFNGILSGCENGSELTWNNEKKAVIMQANKADKCYVYFDKEIEFITFNFTISNVGSYVFSAESNMTWKEWIGSKYDINNVLKLKNDGYVYSSNPKISYPLYDNGREVNVLGSSEIIDNEQYTINTDAICGIM